MIVSDTPKFPVRGIYLLPNLLTTAALFAGFYSIVATLKGFFDLAAMVIFIAMIADSLDGRVARLTNTQTAFGAEYDSISDMVSFGIAPALLGYSWGLESLGKIGWVIAFIYVAATALRLSRFNTQVGMADKRYFQGLPCPAAAAIMAGFIWVLEDNHLVPEHGMVLVFGLFMVAVSVLMVSRVRYHSFKDVHWQGRVPFVTLLILVLLFACVAFEPPEVLFTLALVFGFSGPVLTLWNLRQRKLKRKHK
ncbi:MAG: CDP-diacylglycerol--serine O-phosphatidyltransferase [Gammaproteobacteria bacterium]|nr:CDP-diacylglycerol--serine O-phosphatidyltransferase [Gammaproteobacteria bacterium]